MHAGRSGGDAMKLLRIAHLRIGLGAVIAAYGLFCYFPIASNAAYKLGALHPSGDLVRLAPLWQSTSWFLLAVWAAVVTLFLVVGWRLVRDRQTLVLYVVAVLLHTAIWWVMQSSDAYQQAFNPAELQLDYDMLLGMLAAGAMIWWLEGRAGAHATPA